MTNSFSKISIFQIFGSLVAEMRIVQAEIIIFHFPVGKFALAGGEFFPKGADIAAVLHRQVGGAAVIGKKLLQRLFESGGGFRLGGNGGRQRRKSCRQRS